MAQRTDSYLTTEANIIQNETATGANTALRVGTMLNDVIDSKVNNDRVSDSTVLGNSATLVPSQNAVKTYVDTILVGYLNDRGNYDPTVTSGYPTTGGSGSGGTIEKGDIFFISANGNITSGDAVPVTTPVFTGYTVRALQNTPGQLYANWSISNVGIGYIPENSANKSTDNTMGGVTPSNVLFSTQKAVKEYVDNEIATAVPAPNLSSVLAAGRNLANGRNFQGTGSGTGNLGFNVNGFGTNSAANNSGTDVNVFGLDSGDSNTGSRVNGIGNAAAKDNAGNDINAMGTQAAFNNSGNGVNAFGYQAGLNNTFSNVNLLGFFATANANDQLVMTNDSGFNARISYINLTADRLYELPNSSGTIALVNVAAFTGTRVINAETYTWQNGILISIT